MSFLLITQKTQHKKDLSFEKISLKSNTVKIHAEMYQVFKFHMVHRASCRFSLFWGGSRVHLGEYSVAYHYLHINGIIFFLGGGCSQFLGGDSPPPKKKKNQASRKLSVKEVECPMSKGSGSQWVHLLVKASSMVGQSGVTTAVTDSDRPVPGRLYTIINYAQFMWLTIILIVIPGNLYFGAIFHN